MGSLVICSETSVDAPPSTVFTLFGQRGTAGWLFGAEVDDLRPGGVVHLSIPAPSWHRDPGIPDALEGTARILELVPPKRIVLAHEVPWSGRINLRLEPAGTGTMVRLVAEIDSEGVDWIARRRGGNGLSLPSGSAGDVRIGLLTGLSGTASVFRRASVNCAHLAIN